MTATVVLAGIPISRMGLDAAVERCLRDVADGTGGYACFVNAHTLTQATKHVALREALSCASYCFADGVPLVWLSRAIGAPVATRVAGPDFMAAMLRRAPAIVHGFIGGSPGHSDRIARRAGVCARIHVPPIRPFAAASACEDWQRFLDACPNREPPPIVWLALGAPKQELWLRAVTPIAPNVMFFAVGAAFDFLAHATPRASPLAQRFGLEWAHRLAREPRRLWRRYLEANTRFLVLSIRELSASRRA